MNISDIKIGDVVRKSRSGVCAVVTGIPDHFFLCSPWIWVSVIGRKERNRNAVWTVADLVKVR